MAKALGVSQSTVANWLSRTLKEEKERKRDKAFGLWLACHTQEEIAKAVDVPSGTIPGWEKEFLEKLAADNSRNFSDFDPPIYNKVCNMPAEKPFMKSCIRRRDMAVIGAINILAENLGKRTLCPFANPSESTAQPSIASNERCGQIAHFSTSESTAQPSIASNCGVFEKSRRRDRLNPLPSRPSLQTGFRLQRCKRHRV